MEKKITTLAECRKHDAKLGDVIDVIPESDKTKKSKSKSTSKKKKTDKKDKEDE